MTKQEQKMNNLCAIINNKLYRICDVGLDKSAGRAKPIDPIPEGSIECCPADFRSGRWFYWVLCHRDNPADKNYWEAFDRESNTIWNDDGTGNLEPYQVSFDDIHCNDITCWDGIYELRGPEYTLFPYEENCQINEIWSGVCKLGTKSCDVNHKGPYTQ